MRVPKEGSKWVSADMKQFHVVYTVEISKKIWVHYIEEFNVESIPGEHEYCCYLESFLFRFKEVVE